LHFIITHAGCVRVHSQGIAFKRARAEDVKLNEPEAF